LFTEKPPAGVEQFEVYCKRAPETGQHYSYVTVLEPEVSQRLAVIDQLLGQARRGRERPAGNVSRRKTLT
jgi:hypothetical protein